MYIRKAKMNQRSFYFRSKVDCPVDLPLDRWFVFATTHVLRRSIGLFDRNKITRKEVKNESI